ncbi:hypothetical protein KC19_2G047400 [Ceratodon purpureus]|uniref:TIR domain-containing protein n=1 Tax=Ceratodon purpureus TaxID=3225 RepID=A0A8T0ISZ8_CERPU|nr:hypothetical protein KC19_2G047400 [Ceratodon purpureus]
MDVEHEGGSTSSSQSPLGHKDDSPATLALAENPPSSSGVGHASSEITPVDPDPFLEPPSPSLSSSTREHGAEELFKSGIPLSPGSVGRSHDVYIGLFGADQPSLIRYAKWLRAELELKHGLACFCADRSMFHNSDHRSHDIARGVLHSATHGVVLISRKSFRNPYTIEELTIFLDRGNLVPVFFDVAPPDCLVRDIVEKQGEIWEVDGGELWKAYRGEEKGWCDAMKGLVRVEERRVEAYRKNWRESIHEVASLLGSRLGDPKVVPELGEELPWPRNVYFAGREKELKAMEKMLFSDGNAALPVFASGTVAQILARGSDASSKAEAEESELGRLSNYSEATHEEIHASTAWPYPGSSSQTAGVGTEHRHSSIYQIEPDGGSRESSFGGIVRDPHFSGRQGRVRSRSSREHKRRESSDWRGGSDRSRFAPTCVLTGIIGIGKSELALEYAYRNSQKYRRVIWVGGESRYFRQNYLNQASVLGVDVGVQDATVKVEGRARVRTFEEHEADALHRLRHELERDLPYLLIIDNLDADRDPWDGRDLSEFLPRMGSATHVIITTRLPRVMHLECLEVPYLSSFEALTLMRDGKRSERSFSVQQIDKFKEFEDKLGRLPFGLAIVGRLINEFNMKPSEILAKMGTVETINLKPRNSFSSSSSIERAAFDDVVLHKNPFLVKLLDVCFNLMCNGTGAQSCLAVRMAYVGGWFAPAPCRLSLLAIAAEKLQNELGMRTNFMTSVLSCWMPAHTNGRNEAEASALLTRLGLARASTRETCLSFPDIIKLYCRMRGGIPAAWSFVRAIRKSGSIAQHYDHFWAAMHLVGRGFGGEPAVVEFQVPDLIIFTERVVLPLALRAFNAFSRCSVAVEVLRLWYVMLEDVEKSYVSQVQDVWDQSLCWRRSNPGPYQVDEYVWQDLTLLKALLLEARAKLMVRGGQYEVAGDLCRSCINIRTVMLGADHPDTISAQDTLSKFVEAHR